MLQVKNILQTTKEALEAGSISLQEAARILCKAGFTNFTDVKATVRLLDINSLSLSMMTEATTATAEKENNCTDIQVIEPEEPDEISGINKGREATASAEKQAEINKNKSFKDLKEGNYIRLIQGLGKDNSIKDFISIFDDQDYKPAYPLCKIERIENLTDEELTNYNFLNQKPAGFNGGSSSYIYDLYNNRYNLTPEICSTIVRSVCMLRTPSRCLFVDPQGYEYSRYVLALPVSLRSMFAPEFQELKEEKERQEEEARKAEEEKERQEKETIKRYSEFLSPVYGYDPKATKKNILALLKHNFKGVKFTARKSYESFEISWTDGPSEKEVKTLCNIFVDHDTDITGDYLDYTPSYFTRNFGGIKYSVDVNRKYSEKVLTATIEEIRKEYPDFTGIEINDNKRVAINHESKFIDSYNISCFYDFSLSEIVFNYLKNASFYEELEETATAGNEGSTTATAVAGNDHKEATATAETATAGNDGSSTTTATAGNDETKGLTLIEYSAKAVAVIGDTFPIKDQLKKLGGRFNARLTCGAGWIFSKKREQELRQALNIA